MPPSPPSTPSVTTWTRLEPRARSRDMRTSLEARVHDPLWLLSRQWQLGEYLGDDAGSPVSVRIRADADRLRRYRPGSAAAGNPSETYDGSVPLETLVEREPAAPGPVDARAAADAGLALLRRLSAAGLARYRAAVLAAYPMRSAAPVDGERADPAARRYLTVMGGRVPDGAAAATALRPAVASGVLPTTLGVSAADTAAVLSVLDGWLKRVDVVVSSGSPAPRTGAWDPSRMEYSFAMGVRVNDLASPRSLTDVQMTLGAAEYPGGRLDWTAFGQAGGPGLGAELVRDKLVSTVFPTPAAFPGMPARRYWEFEGARVDFGGVETAPEDLARMLLVEFATVYSNDWYVVPLDVPVGSLTTIRSLIVTDTFGRQTLMPASGAGQGDASWSMFRLGTATGGRAEARLLLPPVLGAGLEADPIEEVALARDEQADQGWAIERTVESTIGYPVNRVEEYARRRSALPAAAPSADVDPAAPLRYRLMSEVPDHWIPLLPVAVGAATRLRRGAVERATPAGTVERVLPLGRILAPGTTLDLPEEEVPHEGAVITRSYQYARWVDGSTHLWVGRRKRPGRGEVASGLHFDAAEAPTRTTPAGGSPP